MLVKTAIHKGRGAKLPSRKADRPNDSDEAEQFRDEPVAVPAGLPNYPSTSFTFAPIVAGLSTETAEALYISAQS